MRNLIIAGIGTNVGKTVASAILTTMMDALYWKPVETGASEGADSAIVRSWIGSDRVLPAAYSLQAPLSPLHAAGLENVEIEVSQIVPPRVSVPLIIEGIGGLLVPLTMHTLAIDLMMKWPAAWIVVSNNYLGSINHTLMTLALLKSRGLNPLGIIFNGPPDPIGEAFIEWHTGIRTIARLLPEKNISSTTIKAYAPQWKHSLLPLLG